MAGMTGSVGACSYQIAYIPDGQTYTATLMGGKGDIFQRYSGDSSAPTNIVPDFEAAAAGSAKPFIRVSVMCSAVEMTSADIASKIYDNQSDWYVNGEKLVFNNQNISTGGSWAGCFRKLTAAAGTNHNADAPHGGLEILKNLVVNSGGANIWVQAVLAIENGNDASKVIYAQGGTSIFMIKSNGQSSFASIYCDPTESFVLESDEANHKKDRVTCKVNCWKGDSKLASNAFKTIFYLLENGEWAEKSKFPTNNEFVITRDDIATFGQVKVECYESDGTTLIASDIQAVNDSSDGYVVLPNPNPADSRLYQTGGPAGITFTPEVRTVNDEAGPACDFVFTLLDTVGGNCTPAGIKGQKLASYTVTKDLVAAHGGIIVNIEAFAK